MVSKALVVSCYTSFLIVLGAQIYVAHQTDMRGVASKAASDASAVDMQQQLDAVRRSLEKTEASYKQACERAWKISGTNHCTDWQPTVKHSLTVPPPPMERREWE